MTSVNLIRSMFGRTEELKSAVVRLVMWIISENRKGVGKDTLDALIDKWYNG